MQVKTTMRCHVSMLNTNISKQRNTDNTSAGKKAEKLESSYTDDENTKWYSRSGKQFGSFS